MNSEYHDGKITFLIPYYNEEDFIGDTVCSLLEQAEPPAKIILVDNGSSDSSNEVCQQIKKESKIDIILLQDLRPGKINALETGLKYLDTEFVALGDADVYYPTHYLKLVREIFKSSRKEIIAVMAQYIEEDNLLPRVQKTLRRTVSVSKIFTTKCFTGGAGQIFRTRQLIQVGGFSTKIWPYVQLDHEIMHRIHKLGRSVYHKDLWLIHPNRRSDRSKVRWSFFDRLLYRYTPHFLGDWYFYKYLGPRHEKRKFSQLRLREQQWNIKKS